MRTLRCASSISALILLGGCPDTPVSFGASSTDEVGDDSTGTDATDDTSTDTGNEELPVDDHRTFFIGESRKFDGGGACDNDNLNTVTSTLRNELVDAGWQGLRFVDEDSWPEDYREASIPLPALDDLFGDTTRLSVYAGTAIRSSYSGADPRTTGRARQPSRA